MFTIVIEVIHTLVETHVIVTVRSDTICTETNEVSNHCRSHQHLAPPLARNLDDPRTNRRTCVSYHGVLLREHRLGYTKLVLGISQVELGFTAST